MLQSLVSSKTRQTLLKGVLRFAQEAASGGRCILSYFIRDEALPEVVEGAAPTIGFPHKGLLFCREQFITKSVVISEIFHLIFSHPFIIMNMCSL